LGDALDGAFKGDAPKRRLRRFSMQLVELGGVKVAKAHPD